MREHKDNEWWALVKREQTLVPSNEDDTGSLLDIPHLLLWQLFSCECHYYLLPRKKWSHNMENFQQVFFIQIWSSANPGLNQKLAYLLSFSFKQIVTSQTNNKKKQQMRNAFRKQFYFSWNYIIQAAYKAVQSWPGYCFDTIIHSNK